jgi:hypothetical protein
MRTLGRLQRLERLAERDGPCPDCARVVLVGPDDPEPEPCPACGREPDQIVIVERLVVGPDGG